MSTKVTSGNEALVYNNATNEISWERDFDKATGALYYTTIQGTKTEVESLETTYKDLGCKVKVKPLTELLYEITIETDNQNNTTNPPGTATVVAEEKWEIITEFEKVSIFNHWKVIKEMAAFEAEEATWEIDGMDYDCSAAHYKASIEKAIKEGKKIAEVEPLMDGLPIAQVVWQAMTRGQKDIRERHPIIRYSRTFPLDSRAAMISAMTDIDAVYPDSLLSGYPLYVPADIIAKLPSHAGVTDVPENTAWGWMVTSDNKVISRYDRKYTESRELTGGFISTVFNTFKTS